MAEWGGGCTHSCCDWGFFCESECALTKCAAVGAAVRRCRPLLPQDGHAGEQSHSWQAQSHGASAACIRTRDKCAFEAAPSPVGKSRPDSQTNGAMQQGEEMKKERDHSTQYGY